MEKKRKIRNQEMNASRNAREIVKGECKKRTRNNVILALRRGFARNLARLLAAQRDKVIHLGHISHDKPLFKVRVDDAGGLRRCANKKNASQRFTPTR
jgi:hypothetical protein